MPGIKSTLSASFAPIKVSGNGRKPGNFQQMREIEEERCNMDHQENLEDVFIDIIDVNTDMDSRQNLGGSDPPGWISPGMLFPDYNSMTTTLDRWSRDNFSPLVKRSYAKARPGHPRPSHTFACPHRKAKRNKRGLGIRRPRKNLMEYVDCPFLIDTKVNADGSCVVTRALTEHSGHEVSEEQFQKYYR